jgi:hypothetical protein
MQFDFKVTTWERISVSADQEEKVLDAIKRGEITSSNDIFNFLEDDGNISIETMLETTEQMTPEENDGQSTIEVLSTNGETIFTNALK